MTAVHPVRLNRPAARLGVPARSLGQSPTPGQTSRTAPRPQRLAWPLALFLAWSLAWSLTLAPSLAQAQGLFQVSTLNALVAGDYEGHATLAELMKHGDFGLGTIEPLDGELAILDGVAYQIAYNGTVRVLPGSTRTPFASAAFFKPDRTTPLDRIPTLGEMERRLDASLPSPNFFYALRVDGRFSFVKTRSVPRQSRPYPPLGRGVQGPSPCSNSTRWKGPCSGSGARSMPRASTFRATIGISSPRTAKEEATCWIFLWTGFPPGFRPSGSSPWSCPKEAIS